MKIPNHLLRRLTILDEILVYNVTHIDTLCHYGSAEEFIDDIITDTITDMYEKHYKRHFQDINMSWDKGTIGWNTLYKSMDKYLRDKFGDELTNYYHINCGD